MPIVNFSIPRNLETRVNSVIKRKGFASKAEFFRLAAMNFIDLGEQSMSLDEDQEFEILVSAIKNKIRKQYAGKKLPSLEAQLADI